jgi:hypothetical protein
MDLVVGYSGEEEIERRVDPPVAQAAPPALNVFARVMTQAKAAASPRNAPKRKEPMNTSDVNMPVDRQLQAAGSVEGDRAAEDSISSKDDSNYASEAPGSDEEDGRDAEDDGAYIPKILAEEMAEIQTEIMGDYGSLTIDGTGRNGEALAGDFRSCKYFDLENRLVQFKTTAKNVQGIDLAATITNLRTLTLHKSVESLTCISRDGCSVNHVASANLTVAFQNSDGLICIGHLLALNGDKLTFPLLK